MITKETLLPVLDNSGAKRVLCIRPLNRNKKGIAYPGDILVITVKTAIPKKLKKKKKILKHGEIYKALLLSSRKGFMRKLGHRIAGSSNGVVLLRKENIFLPYGNRLRAPIFREVRSDFSKIIIMAPNLI